ncbi:MAG TPA: M15 family metallopeptidase [Bacteroidia bacterium]|jgi:D-alanyl-D-alanine dipeptidase|nr:M15 family metallopeptidase [Bacteroidia bacterium]
MPANSEVKFKPNTFNTRFSAPPEVRRGMGNPDIMRVLETRVATYEDLKGVKIRDNGEPLVPVPNTAGLTYHQRGTGIYAATGPRVFLREGIVDRLVAAGRDLDREFPGYKFGILEGYRPLEQQKKEFAEAEAAVRNQAKSEDLSEMEIKNRAHLRSAAPDVGGHVAGPAFDFMLLNSHGTPVRMGTGMSRWVDRSWQHHPDITKDGKRARATAANILAEHDIKIFEGEFWHGHYGDVEWAWLNNEPYAIYGPVDFIDEERFSHLTDSRGRRFAEYIGSTLGQPLHLPSDQSLPDSLRSVDPSELVQLQRVHQPSWRSPRMRQPLKSK